MKMGRKKIHSQLSESSDVEISQEVPTSGNQSEGSVSGRKSRRDKKFSWPIYRKFFQYTLKRWKRALLSIIFTIFSGLTISLFPWKVGQVLDLVTQTANTSSSTHAKELQTSVLTVGFLALFQGIFSFLRYTCMSLLQEKLSIDMRTDIYQMFIKNDLFFFEQHKTGELISRLSSDINQAKSAISNNLAYMIRNILTLVGNIIIIVTMSWRLTLCVLIIVPIYVLIVFQYTKRAKVLIRQKQDMIAEMASHIGEKFNGVQVVKAFCSEHIEVEKYRQLNEQVYDINWKRVMYQGVQITSSSLLPSIGTLIVLWYGGYLAIYNDGGLTPGLLTSFIMYCNSLSSTTSGISNSYTNIINGTQACQKVFEMMEYQPSFSEEEGREVEIDGSIEFDSVSFSYPSSPSTKIFQNLSFNIKAGEYVAFVGQSGSGKSTIVKLIEHLYKITNGVIWFGNQNVREVSIKSLRQQIGLVSQDATIFSGTVEENIAYGLKDYDQEDVQRAARKSGCMEFLSNENLFPEGFQTVIGERGSTLSGGQRQRICIARALMRKPKILIFDEATSALDSNNENLVKQSIEEIANQEEKITIIVVAHRLSTVINCDRLFVMKDGEIVENGNHRDLISQGGYYQSLIQKQLHEKNVPQI